jgi:hypothetical protein
MNCIWLLKKIVCKRKNKKKESSGKNGQALAGHQKERGIYKMAFVRRGCVFMPNLLVERGSRYLRFRFCAVFLQTVNGKKIINCIVKKKK